MVERTALERTLIPAAAIIEEMHQVKPPTFPATGTKMGMETARIPTH